MNAEDIIDLLPADHLNLNHYKKSQVIFNPLLELYPTQPLEFAATHNVSTAWMATIVAPWGSMQGTPASDLQSIFAPNLKNEGACFCPNNRTLICESREAEWLARQAMRQQRHNTGGRGRGQGDKGSISREASWHLLAPGDGPRPIYRWQAAHANSFYWALSICNEP